MDIDEVYVVYFTDFQNYFQKTNGKGEEKICCVEIPVLLSNGTVEEADTYFTPEIQSKMSTFGRPINTDFTSVPYINRFMSCLIHLKMKNLKIVDHKKKNPFNYFEVTLEWVRQKKKFILRCPVIHHELLIEFMVDHGLYIRDKKRFVYIEDGSMEKFSDQKQKEIVDFPVLKYKHFKKLFQSAFYYDKDQSNDYHVMYKPVTSIMNGYTIDLADFEEYENSYKIFEIETFENTGEENTDDEKQDNDNDEESQSENANSNKKDENIIYKIGQEFFLPNIPIRNFINAIMQKQLMCNQIGEICFKQ